MGETIPIRKPAIFHSANLLTLSQRALDAKDYQKAFDISKEILLLSPFDPEANFIAGISSFYLKNYENAIYYFEQLLEDVPDYPELHYFLGSAFYFLDQSEKAIHHLKSACLYDPKNPKAHFSLAKIFHNLKDWENAKKFFYQAIILSPLEKKFWIHLGKTLKEEERIDEAEAILNYVELEGQGFFFKPELNALYHLSLYLFEIKEFSLASSIFQRLLIQSPQEKRCLNYLGIIAFEKGNYERGYQIFENQGRIPEDILPLLKNKILWEGQSLKEKNVLILKDSDIADTILLASCFQELIESAEKVIIETHPQLFSLFTYSFPNATIIQSNNLVNYIKNIDYYSSKINLLKILRPSLESFKEQKPYFQLNKERQDYVQSKFKNFFQSKIGFFWKNDQSPFIQKKLKNIFDQHQLSIIDYLKYNEYQDILNDFQLLLSILSSYDLVITNDRIIAFLASAICIETWVILNEKDWRMFGTDGFPFYPKMTVFQKRKYENWDVVLFDLNQKLEEYIKS